jgi:hypothetical protein
MGSVEVQGTRIGLGLPVADSKQKKQQKYGTKCLFFGPFYRKNLLPTAL